MIHTIAALTASMGSRSQVVSPKVWVPNAEVGMCPI
jgi:hypothetical protein